MKLRFNSFRNAFTSLYDASAAGLTFLAALYLRWSDDMWHHAAEYMWQGAACISFIMLVLVLYTRLYRRFWRYVSMKDITTILKVCATAMLLFYGAFFLLNRLEMLPRSVPIFHTLLLLCALIAPRVMNRAWHEKSLKLPEAQQVPVLIIGATDEAETFIRESMRSANFPYRVVGVVATDGSSVGRNIHHVKIYGDLKDIPAILRKLKRKGDAAQRLILSTHCLAGAAISDLLKVADSENISMARIPRLSDLTRGDAAAQDIKPIEVEDLLGRAQAKLDMQAMRDLITGKIVLITGAGGSIGSELVRQVAEFKPRRIVCFEQNEYALYRIDCELRENYPDQSRKSVLGDVRDEQALKNIFAEHKPQIVFHAAALKHVPLCEMNPAQAVLTNVMGTQIVADACVAAGVQMMVQISTDKAVNPTNVMGACKRIGESYAQALGQSQSKTRFVTVRFGNVLGSTGSVVPLFQRQLQQGGPLTVTDPEMTRYFMTIREAVRLVIQAACFDSRDDTAPIYVLEMGAPVKIDDLARQMIRLAGLRPDDDIAISYTGLRPGEKLYEELFYDSENLLDTEHESISRAAAREVAIKLLHKQLDQLYKFAHKNDGEQLVVALQTIVPEYKFEIKKASA